MKNLSFILFISLSTLVLSQENIQLFTGFSSSFTKEIISNKSSQIFGQLDFNIGARIHQEEGDLDVSLAYQFSSNVVHYTNSDSVALVGKYYKHYDSNGNEIDIYNSLQRNHFLGATLRYIFKERSKRFRPFIQFSIRSEIGTNYKNGYLMDEEFIPRFNPVIVYHTPPANQKPYDIDYLYSHFYHSTPFIGSFLFGYNLKVIENLHLNLALGYGFRIMKIKYAEWTENEDVYEKLRTIPTTNNLSQMIDLQLGLTYAFSFKKKSENTKN